MKQHPHHKGVPQHYGRGKAKPRGRVVRTSHTPGLKKYEQTSEWGCFRRLSGGGAVIFACVWMITGLWRRR